MKIETREVFSEARHELLRVNSLDEYEQHRRRSPKRVAIIGAGASGLICARECIREGHSVRVFEKASNVGGTWRVESVPSELQSKNINYDQLKKTSCNVHSSMYDSVRVNIPRELMGFTDYPFNNSFPGSEDSRRFCKHTEVKRYLDAFAEHFDLGSVVQYESNVLRVEPVEGENSMWDVEVVHNGERIVHHFDAVVVANGNYSVPIIPEIKEIERFQTPCLHSHLYRNTKNFEGKTVVILGNSMSGTDLSKDYAEVSENVYLCGRTWPANIDMSKPSGPRQNIHFCKGIDRCTGKGELTLTDGKIIRNVDLLVFCTGYQYDLSFLKAAGIVTVDEHTISPMYHSLVHVHHPTLAILNIPHKTVAFIMAEYQSKYLARLYSGRCRLPSKDTMLSAIKKSKEDYIDEHRSLKGFLTWRERHFEYMDQLAKLCGDVNLLPPWRKQLYIAVQESRNQFRDQYKDMEFSDACYTEAKLDVYAHRPE